MSSIDDSGIAPNAKRLLWAGFMAILAAGVGFSIRGGILGDWGEQFGFTQGDLGKITGGGLTGFGIIILIGALLADKLGYGTLMCLAFVAHLSHAWTTWRRSVPNQRLGIRPCDGRGSWFARVDRKHRI